MWFQKAAEKKQCAHGTIRKEGFDSQTSLGDDKSTEEGKSDLIRCVQTCLEVGVSVV